MLFGVLLGLVLAEVLVLREMSMPMVIFAYAIPHPVVAPVFIIWFITVLDPIVLLEFTGPSAYLLRSVTAKEATRQFVLNGVTTFAAWVGFFPVFLGTITGMNALEERFEHPGTVLGATRFQMVRYFRFWRALPNIASSQGVGYQIVLALGRGAAVAAHGGEHERLETGPLDSRDDTADDRGQVGDAAAANPQGDLAAIGISSVGRSPNAAAAAARTSAIGSVSQACSITPSSGRGVSPQASRMAASGTTSEAREDCSVMIERKRRRRLTSSSA